MDLKGDVDKIFHSEDLFSYSVLERAGNDHGFLFDATNKTFGKRQSSIEDVGPRMLRVYEQNSHNSSSSSKLPSLIMNDLTRDDSNNADKLQSNHVQTSNVRPNTSSNFAVFNINPSYIMNEGSSYLANMPDNHGRNNSEFDLQDEDVTNVVTHNDRTNVTNRVVNNFTKNFTNHTFHQNIQPYSPESRQISNYTVLSSNANHPINQRPSSYTPGSLMMILNQQQPGTLNQQYAAPSPLSPRRDSVSSVTSIQTPSPSHYKPFASSNSQPRSAEERKKIHKMNEQTYRNNLNGMLQEIDKIIPKLPNGNLDLQKAFTYPSTMIANSSKHVGNGGSANGTGAGASNNKANILKEAIVFIVEADKHIKKLFLQSSKDMKNSEGMISRNDPILGSGPRSLRLQELLSETVTSNSQPAFRTMELQREFGAHIEVLRSQVDLLQSNSSIISQMANMLGEDPNKYLIPFPVIVQGRKPSLNPNLQPYDHFNRYDQNVYQPTKSQSFSLHDLLAIPRPSDTTLPPLTDAITPLRRSFSSPLLSPLLTTISTTNHYTDKPSETTDPETLSRRRSTKRYRNDTN